MTRVLRPTVHVALDAAALGHFAEHGWLLTATLDVAGIAALRDWVEVVASWPDDGDGWLQHRELTDDGPQLCRSENIVGFHDGLAQLLTTGQLLETASALLGERAVLYKEKINYKLPGGAGYAPHQDAPAYPFIDAHVSCMVAVDDATLDNGCLEVVSGEHHAVLPVDATGCVRPDVVDRLDWAAVEVGAGETLWFHSRTPHRSGANRSAQARRALYPTYNAASEGDLRADYYREKLAEFDRRRNDGSHTGVSLIGDFQGRPV